jgi:hypothetical protein
LNDPHARVLRKEFRQQALMCWSKVLDNDKGSSAVIGQGGQKSFEGLKGAGRSAYAHHRDA